MAVAQEDRSRPFLHPARRREVKLPELPKSTHAILKDGKWLDGYTPEELRAYGEAVREACAKLCDELPYWPENEENHDVSDGAGACADAIRKDTP
jgi:hypothetical protein